MKNYVIINGTNSNTLTGLMINELPPITKPEMRTQVEEIDGRDGDIITKLGYSAYDKTITIGLWGTAYDVNEVIKFFNKEGTIVFSNEADKYYNFTMVNSIDIERLLKFKTASITFHCQPFKYPTIETQKIIQPTILTSDGESITINNTASDSLKLSLKGNTSQSGTPTPTSPIPVSVVSGDNEVLIRGINIFDKETVLRNKTFTSANVVSDSTGLFISDYIKVEPNTTYYTNENAPVVIGLDKDKSALGYIRNTSSAGSFTTQATCEYIRVRSHSTTIPMETAIANAMIHKGSASVDYEPYQSQTYEVDLPVGLELCKIGTYQDYFTKNSDGEWCKYNAIGKVVLDGTQASSGLYNGNTNTSRNIFEALPYNCRVYIDNILSKCNLFPYNNMWSKDEEGYFFDDNSKRIIVRISKATLGGTTQTDWDNWLSSHNLICYYALETPYLSLIEDEGLIGQLDNIQNAMSYEGTTNINQVNNDKAFIISASAVQSGTNEITINNIGNIYSKPLLALEGNGNVDIYLDNTQILKANVESKMNIDINTLEAYNPDTMTLLNRQVIGNYNSMTFQPGNNKLTINGSLSKATITNYTRYL